MQRQKLIDKILNNERTNIQNKLMNNLASIVASVFSILFALSLIREAYLFTKEWYVLILLTVFTVLFLIFNEYHKVLELRKRFQFGGKRGSMFIIVFTCAISIAMSSIGIFLWTDKTLQESTKNDQIATDAKNSITLRYNHSIDSVMSIDIRKQEEYVRLNSDLSYWKGRSAASLEEREYIRTQIERIQRELSAYGTKFTQSIDEKVSVLEESRDSEIQNSISTREIRNRVISRSGAISSVFLIMVLLTEIIIIFLAKQRGDIDRSYHEMSRDKTFQRFRMEYNTITEIISRKGKIGYEKDGVNNIKYCPFYEWNDFEDVKKTYGLLRQIGVIKEGVTLEQAQKLLKDYYENILKLKF